MYSILHNSNDKIMALVIEIINGKFTVNGKQLSELNQIESKFLDDFFREKKAKESQILNR